MKILKKPLLSIINEHVTDYPSPLIINYFWSFGFLAINCLIIQIVSGILLAMHYTPHVDLAFLSLEHIMRDVNNGWLLRYTHANGASFFFVVVYTHIAKNLYYGSYFQPRGLLWKSGMLIFLIMMAVGFMGYVLPWGQMSFWGATVITNLFSAIPVIGPDIAQWLWGGFSVNNATLNKFFSLHYTLGFALLGIVMLHFVFLHFASSGNPLGTPANPDKVGLYPYFIIKDFFVLLVLIAIYSFFVFFYPNYLGHPDNYIEANALVTPTHIVPEWYFLPFYAILRSIPDKLLGVIAMGLAIVLMLLLPYITMFHDYVKSLKFNYIGKIFYFYFVIVVLLLGWLGGEVAEEPYIFIAQIISSAYFLYILVFINLTLFLSISIARIKK